MVNTFYIVNLDKKEYLHPHKMGSGLKLWEICASNMPRVLPYLLEKSTDGSVAGDAGENLGRWAGDRIVVIGDYDDSELYDEVNESYIDISLMIRDEIDKFLEISEYKMGERWDTK